VRPAVVLRASLTGLCLLSLASGAEAAEARRRFNIAPKPYSEALIDLAVHAFKDLPASLTEGLAVAAIGHRDDPRARPGADHTLRLAHRRRANRAHRPGRPQARRKARRSR
jgi:hypothetical protein